MVNYNSSLTKQQRITNKSCIQFFIPLKVIGKPNFPILTKYTTAFSLEGGILVCLFSNGQTRAYGRQNILSDGGTNELRRRQLSLSNCSFSCRKSRFLGPAPVEIRSEVSPSVLLPLLGAASQAFFSVCRFLLLLLFEICIGGY